MLKLFLVEFKSNLAYGLNGWKRENFKKWDKVIVLREDSIRLMRLGCELLNEVNVSFKTHKDLFKQSKDVKVEAPAETETEKVEAPAETKTVETTEKTGA